MFKWHFRSKLTRKFIPEFCSSVTKRVQTIPSCSYPRDFHCVLISKRVKWINDSTVKYVSILFQPGFYCIFNSIVVFVDSNQMSNPLFTGYKQSSKRHRIRDDLPLQQSRIYQPGTRMIACMATLSAKHH
jgi:hypothetical protein